MQFYASEALQLKPNYTEVYNNLGVALKEKGDLDAAIDSYDAALQLNPTTQMLTTTSAMLSKNGVTSLLPSTPTTPFPTR